MNTRVVQKGEDLICLNHNQPIIMVIMDNSISFQDIMLCGQCLQEKQTISTKIIGITQVRTMINEKYQKLNEKQEQNIQQFSRGLEEFQQKISQLRTQILQSLDETLRISESWLNQLQMLQLRPHTLDLVKEIQQLYNSSNQRNNGNQIENVNMSCSKKLYLIFNKSLNFEEYQSSYDQLNKLKIHLFGEKSKQLDFQHRQIRLEQLNFIQQKEQAHAMAFNISSTIMVAACRNDIKVWKFLQGTLTEIKRLKGHSMDIYCIVFSKKQNWFASGSIDKTIRCWKEQKNNEWVSNSPQSKHDWPVNCLLLNKIEDQLISCSNDNSIKIWKVNCQSNQLTFDYSLEENIHEGTVNSISLNESEGSLVSCSSDMKIVLWMKGKDQRWKYQNHMIKDEYGYRICFINENQIMWQQWNLGFTQILEIKNGQLRDKPELKIKLKEATDDFCLFPTIVNKKQQIIIQKHNRFIYIIRQQQDASFQVVGQPIIDCLSQLTFGALTEEGDYLVIWNDSMSGFIVYKINYQ